MCKPLERAGVGAKLIRACCGVRDLLCCGTPPQGTRVCAVGVLIEFPAMKKGFDAGGSSLAVSLWSLIGAFSEYIIL